MFQTSVLEVFLLRLLPFMSFIVYSVLKRFKTKILITKLFANEILTEVSVSSESDTL